MKQLRLIASILWTMVVAFAAPPAFDLRDTAGAHHTAKEWPGKKAVVLFFIMTDCPLSNGYVPELNRIRADYEKQGVAVYAVHADPTIGDAAVRKHADEFGYTFPVLLDPKLTLAHVTGATTVPEVAVFSAAGELRYLGRIDNRMEDITRRRTVATQHELRDALDAMIAGGVPKLTRTRAVGCSINLEGIK
ncbi:MAG: redoxin domain-containing protein [Acidobacteriota bacterium]